MKESEKNTLLQPTMNDNNKRYWAGLVPKLVQVIATKVTDIFDFIRFRVVCKTWRSSTTIADLSSQFPCILCDREGPDLCFYSFASDKSFTIHAPKFSDKHLFESCCGYMLVRSLDVLYQLSLINPLTNREISLPPLGYNYYHWVGSRNFKSGDYVIFQGPCTSFCVCKPGDEKWVYRKTTSHYCYLVSKNLLFMIDNDSHRFTTVIDISTHKTIYVVPPPQDSSTLLIKTSPYSIPHPILIESFGEVLSVTYIREFEKFEIYRFEAKNDSENPRWVKITSIDRMLFIDGQQSYGHCISRATELHGLKLKGNCIYILGDRTKLFPLQYRNKIERYDIESGTMECIHCPEGEKFTWYFPSLNHI